MTVTLSWTLAATSGDARGAPAREPRPSRLLPIALPPRPASGPQLLTRERPGRRRPRQRSPAAGWSECARRGCVRWRPAAEWRPHARERSSEAAKRQTARPPPTPTREPGPGPAVTPGGSCSWRPVSSSGRNSRARVCAGGAAPHAARGRCFLLSRSTFRGPLHITTTRTSLFSCCSPLLSTRVTHFNTEDARTSVSTRLDSRLLRGTDAATRAGPGLRGAARGASSRTPDPGCRGRVNRPASSVQDALQVPGTRPGRAHSAPPASRGGAGPRGPEDEHVPRPTSHWASCGLIRSAGALQALAVSRVTRTASVTHVTNAPSGKPFGLRFWDHSSHRTRDALPGQATTSAFLSVGSASASHWTGRLSSFQIQKIVFSIFSTSRCFVLTL